ncbi:hypothetical protein BDV96DRAFT_217767 [Lophiotrema nucula]|uniref:Uncharacterized protein n=1 Tax=Lophiotrema nucula TaxID=690887 RepID=A0A6A5ZQA4_9PLEO|nr:hypothetical protein BDV96DRAFT_217767 [Lophiotrema nucula]
MHYPEHIADILSSTNTQRMHYPGTVSDIPPAPNDGQIFYPTHVSDILSSTEAASHTTHYPDTVPDVTTTPEIEQLNAVSEAKAEDPHKKYSTDLTSTPDAADTHPKLLPVPLTQTPIVQVDTFQPSEATTKTSRTYMRTLLQRVWNSFATENPQLSKEQSLTINDIFVEGMQRCLDIDHSSEKVRDEVLEKVDVVAGLKRVGEDSDVFKWGRVGEFACAPLGKEWLSLNVDEEVGGGDGDASDENETQGVLKDGEEEVEDLGSDGGDEGDRKKLDKDDASKQHGKKRKFDELKRTHVKKEVNKQEDPEGELRRSVRSTRGKRYKLPPGAVQKRELEEESEEDEKRDPENRGDEDCVVM